MQNEIATNLQEVGETVKKSFQNFYEKTGRKLHIEIEPGTYLVANAGAIVGAIEDIVDT
jgi:diaminopimelate decarboxylase